MRSFIAALLILLFSLNSFAYLSSEGGGSGGGAWGDITGTLSDQTDLQDALDDKADLTAIDNTAYNQSTWNEVTTKSPTQDSVRDIIESLITSISGKQATLTAFAESISSASPNATRNVSAWSVTTATTNSPVAIVPKGVGGFQMSIPDGTSVGGNVRGDSAFDGQMVRALPGQVGSGSYSVLFGRDSVAGGTDSIAIGRGINSAGNNSSIGIGYLNSVTASYGFAVGFGCDIGSVVSRHCFSGQQIASTGDSQSSDFYLWRSTTNDTPVFLGTDGAGTVATTQLRLANNSAYAFTGTILAKRQSSTDTSMWKVEGLVIRGANAAATTLVTSSITAISNVPSLTTPALSADTTLGTLAIQVTGKASENWRWRADIRTNELVY